VQILNRLAFGEIEAQRQEYWQQHVPGRTAAAFLLIKTESQGTLSLKQYQKQTDKGILMSGRRIT
jgi:hypothetical protein